MRFVLLMHQAKKRERKTRDRNPQKDHRSQIRNEVDPSPLYFWGEGSTHKLFTLTFGRTLSLFTKDKGRGRQHWWKRCRCICASGWCRPGAADRSGGVLQFRCSEIAGLTEVAFQQSSLDALVGDPVAFAALLGLATCGKTACSANKSEGGNAGQPLEPLWASRREREGLCSEDSGEGAVVFGIAHSVGRRVGAPGQRMGGWFRHRFILISVRSVLPNILRGRGTDTEDLLDRVSGHSTVLHI